MVVPFISIGKKTRRARLGARSGLHKPDRQTRRKGLMRDTARVAVFIENPFATRPSGSSAERVRSDFHAKRVRRRAAVTGRRKTVCHVSPIHCNRRKPIPVEIIVGANEQRPAGSPRRRSRAVGMNEDDVTDRRLRSRLVLCLRTDRH